MTTPPSQTALLASELLSIYASAVAGSASYEELLNIIQNKLQISRDQAAADGARRMQSRIDELEKQLQNKTVSSS